MRYPEIIEKIHSEFNSCGEEMLKEAESLLLQAQSRDCQKGLTLNTLGFVNAKQVKESLEIVEKKKDAIKDRDLILHYSTNYPLNKFITVDKVVEICKKYNLMKGPISNYMGFVPEKNVKDMLEFKKRIKKDDLPENFIKIKKYRHPELDEPGIRQLQQKYPDGCIPFNKCNFYSTTITVTIDPITNHKYNSVSVDECEEHKFTDWEICAPETDFDTKDLKKRGFFFFKNPTIKISIPDPVVLQPVKGGYLIITAWGDEASDPIIVNEKMN